ncbi:DHH family phosphoesterase [Candidatus Woesearchaeota archaeon]|nr:DHH family phosphoesterase [Candidatus Woesearchaeota archaeon]
MELTKNVHNFIAFIQSLSPTSRIAAVHDTDPDGMSSAVLLKKGLEKLNFKLELNIPKHHGERNIHDELLKELKEHNIDTVIYLDIAAETYPDIKRLENYKVLVLDHHPTIKDIPVNFTIIKPESLQDELDNHQFCTAELVYRLFSELTSMEELQWLACVGIIGDSCYKPRKNFVDKVLTENKVHIKPNIFDTEFSDVTEFCSYADCVGTKHAYKTVFESLYYAKEYKQAIESLKEFAPVKTEIHRALDNFEKEKEVHGNIIFYNFQSDYYINSVVSTILSHNNTKPSTTLLVAQEVGSFMKISARRQDMKENMGKLLQKATKHLPDATGGGHIPAAGATVRKEDFNDFKKNILKEHKKK